MDQMEDGRTERLNVLEMHFDKIASTTQALNDMVKRLLEKVEEKEPPMVSAHTSPVE